MKRVLLTVALMAGLVAPATSAQAQSFDHDDDDRYRRVAYFINWGIYGRNYNVKNLDTSGAAAKLTHLNYAFGFVDAEGKCIASDPWADWQRPIGADLAVDGVADPEEPGLKGNFQQIKKLKAKHPGLKALISLGGWSGSKYFSDAVLTPERRSALAASCIDLWIKGNVGGLPAGAAAGVFDGIDLDWEWPGSDGNEGNIIRPEDKRNFTLFVAELRRQLDAVNDDLLISAYLPAAAAKIDAGFEVRKVFSLMDYATIQGYDLHVSGEARTGHNGNLYTDRRDPNPVRYSVDQTVRDYLKRGAPANKIVVGIPAFGQGWTGLSGGGDGLYNSATAPAPATWVAGSDDYKNLVKLPGKRYRDQRTGAQWLYDGKVFWSYDDPSVVRQKAHYIKDRRLGGYMMWSIDQDDDQATLTSALYRVLR
ncbi:glycoside hydrolase family 18 protein [Sinosporangium siamense]|uniref:glycoside hydrolase family 18 protein n=1 Tax=Sinosporangium siamense TaxID=1367973 RepID=UPI001950C0EB|nr:glycoside hydrolase family 18 protein [Sinosporangium siamense]